MPREIIIPGQQETCITADLVRPPGDNPFVCVVVTGPDNALCLKLTKPTLGDLIRRLQALQHQIRQC